MKRCLLGAVLLTICGCNQPSQSPRAATDPRSADPISVSRDRNELKQVFMACQNFWEAHNKGPSKAEDLKPYMAESPGAYERLQSGFYNVVWDAHFTRQEMGRSNVLLAFERNADANGKRAVVMLDGSSAILNEQEFANTPKAQRK